ncbi:hypothetical protein KI688_010783 [Linnemannia hyalina]|uniref:Uncharacterized protein n=1 Tax=Linnemannia hyalina TaxID=64524 RepID=A0A9P7XWG3_9FUNG|nr:hypothetical protein KI688_010783 [Linnemannia hyalina]
MSTASDSRSWSISTTSTAVAGVGGGRSFPETKEQSNWIHLSAPNHHLTLTLKLCFRPQTQADLDGCRPLLFIQTGNEVLKSLGLDRASVKSSKLRGIVKGSMIGFRYTSSSSSSASSSLAPTPGSSLSESHKFQIKFKTLTDCGQCSSLLSSWIECQSVVTQSSSSTQLATTDIITTAASASTSSQTLSPAPAPVSIPVHVDGEELTQILRSAASNSIVLPHTAPTTASMLLPPQHQHQQQQQRNRQARLSITPQSASQSTPMAMAMPATSNSSSMTTSGRTARMSSVAPSDCGVQSLQSSMGASCQQRNIEINEGSFHNNISVNNNDSASISFSTTNNDDLSALLNLPNAKLQEDIDIILHDPLFQDLLVKVDQLLRGGPISKR